jgi:hypothetical protein
VLELFDYLVLFKSYEVLIRLEIQYLRVKTGYSANLTPTTVRQDKDPQKSTSRAKDASLKKQA